MLAIFVGTQLYRLLRGEAEKVFDVRSVASYGFDLSNCPVRDELIGTLYARGQQPALDHPRTMPAAAIKAGQSLMGTYKLVPADRVLGVELEGRCRAYPLWVLAPHEICNDTLAGRQIAVAYNPLCDSALAFDRRVGERVLEFGSSGLIYNSAGLLYDRQGEVKDESLWQPLALRAIAGPAAGTSLPLLPATLATWGTWHGVHPDTDVALPDPQHQKKYRPNGYLYYLNEEKLRYPVQPLAPQETLPWKTTVTATRQGPAWKLERWLDGAIPEDPQAPRMYAFWFAWYAAHPDATAP